MTTTTMTKKKFLEGVLGLAGQDLGPVYLGQGLVRLQEWFALLVAQQENGEFVIRKALLDNADYFLEKTETETQITFRSRFSAPGETLATL